MKSITQVSNGKDSAATSETNLTAWQNINYRPAILNGHSSSPGSYTWTFVTIRRPFLSLIARKNAFPAILLAREDDLEGFTATRHF
jgi:hypothetical protein